MTAGILVVTLDGDEPGVRRAERSLADQDLVCGFRFAWDGGEARVWQRAAQACAVESVTTAAGTACCVGPLWYRGRFGAQALECLLDDARANAGTGGPYIDEAGLRGNFAAFLYVDGRGWLINDPLGFSRIYCSADRRLHSTSWLAARAYAGTAEIDDAAAIEYVLQGACHSDRTVARGVDKLPLGMGLDLSVRANWRRFQEGLAPDADESTKFASIDEAVDHIAEVLRTSFREIAAAYSGRISAALSGGFDSRLIVAGLLGQGEVPRLFVYGGPGSEDVPIARQVAHAEGIPLRVVDKGLLNRALPSPDLGELVRCALFFDGLPNDGIDDPGADRSTRLEQHVDGSLALNGGGGEIFRNFFHLPDRSYRALDLVRSFYRGFDSKVFRRSTGLRDYEEAMALSIARSLGLPDDSRSAGRSLQRGQIELAYPLFRCHHWMGLNNSVSLRYGDFSTPLVDLNTVRLSASLPIDWKNAGALQCRLIAALHPGVARHRSAYGFSFNEGPDARMRRSERLDCLRPVALRPLIGSVRRRLQRDRVPADLVRRYRQMLPGEWRLDPLLDLERLPAAGAFERALSIEVVSRELAP